MPYQIFLSYRNEDSPSETGRLYDKLTNEFGEDALFYDKERIGLGRWPEYIHKALEECKVLIAVIGPDWYDIKDEQGRLRIKQSGDWVRREIATALKADKIIIPVCVNNAEFHTKKDKYPNSISGIVKYTSRNLNSWKSDYNDLLSLLKDELKTREKTSEARGRRSSSDTFEPIGDGEFKNSEGKYLISVKPTAFFYYRLKKAFPGVRGLKWYEGESAVDRLGILLRETTEFHISEGYNTFEDPIWWMRGPGKEPISQFKRLTNEKCVMNEYELSVARIAVLNHTSYYKCFVYVEVNPDTPIGLYDYSEEKIQSEVINHGYAYEEFGIWEGIPITREESFDGAAEISGKVVNVAGSEWRKRYLSRYNFLIAAKTSPYGSKEGYFLVKEFMKMILEGSRTIEQFIAEAEKLDRNSMDQ